MDEDEEMEQLRAQEAKRARDEAKKCLRHASFQLGKAAYEIDEVSVSYRYVGSQLLDNCCKNNEHQTLGRMDETFIHAWCALQFALATHCPCSSPRVPYKAR